MSIPMVLTWTSMPRRNCTIQSKIYIHLPLVLKGLHIKLQVRIRGAFIFKKFRGREATYGGVRAPFVDFYKSSTNTRLLTAGLESSCGNTKRRDLYQLSQPLSAKIGKLCSYRITKYSKRFFWCSDLVHFLLIFLNIM